ncbi:hypothetical protein ACT17_23380 [Mycolicibacterium conceptionense]|uniref:DUF732 domain-containing protein n=2 Tax=Mycolicibacterium TaxID=1866885 RepID=A0A0J8U2Q2_9MYCO|nr:hypothetical protein [Mycolicibacterium conceptionense]KLI07497.1 hypothetical protein AA982_14595 [Mycolicibacterium senegalense]KLO50784.1 hypothetical protein ABW05_03980 [Mycolicibacterium senegalense]KMV15838.1 hypothetical protein ACT17_23380 [Mycolicibacterium conceptionense]OBK04875.1 hypothetical protein A5639_19390 [Mycolicibacterium conceptionense]OMB72059.1 hypothetical protein A5741_06480 [Mycolicibacterium conceptionense]
MAAVVAGVGLAPSAAADDKYTQTWPTPYDQTTCKQFLGQMTAKQRWAMAADMLTGARNMKSKTGLPSDSMVTEFEGGLETACVIDTMTMTDVGAGLYMTEPRFHP